MRHTEFIGDSMYKVTLNGVTLMIGSERRCFKWVVSTFWDTPILELENMKIVSVK